VGPNLQHAVIAAEDARFYQHHGLDWHEIQIAADDDLEKETKRRLAPQKRGPKKTDKSENQETFSFGA
jgi:Transglycosylase